MFLLHAYHCLLRLFYQYTATLFYDKVLIMLTLLLLSLRQVTDYYDTPLVDT